MIGGSDVGFLNGRIQDTADLSKSEKMTLMDFHSYFPNDFLCIVAMGVSLEARVLLLDHILVEFPTRVSLAMKTFDNQAKWSLKQVLFKHISRELIECPEKSFSIPLAKWLRDGLKNWANDLLYAEKLQQQGFFHVDAVQKLWQEHISEECNWACLLWNILMFQAWYEKNRS